MINYTIMHNKNMTKRDRFRKLANNCDAVRQIEKNLLNVTVRDIDD